VVSSRNRRSVAEWLAGAVVVGGALLGTFAAQGAQAVPAAFGNNPGAVKLDPASGPTNSKPTWSTTVGCPSGFQGSAVFSEVHADGTTFTTIAPVVTGTLNAFHGTLLTTMAQIKSIGGIANGGTQELFVQCASGLGGTGNVKNDMNIFVTYSADGSTYSTSTTVPSGSGSSSASGASSTGSAEVTGSGSSAARGATPSVTTGTSAGSGGTTPTSRPSVAPSPSALPSSFAVTG
jgi:hypothetical protein